MASKTLTRSAEAAAKVAKDVGKAITGQPSPTPPADSRSTRNVSLSTALVCDVEEKLAGLKRQAIVTSFSGLVDIGLRQLLADPNLPATLERYGINARNGK